MSSEDLWPWRSGDRPGLTSAFALALTTRLDADLIESRRSCLLRLRDRSTKRVSASGRADLSDRCRELCRRDLLDFYASVPIEPPFLAEGSSA